MKSTFVSIVVIAMLFPITTLAQGRIHGNADEFTPRDRFIVVFDRQMVRSADEAHARAHALATAHGAEVLNVYDRVLGGFLVSMPEAAAKGLADSPFVREVWYDLPVRAAQVQNNPDWGLDRVDQRSQSLDNKYIFDFNAQGVRIYIFDTGVRATHVDFGGRVFNGGNFVPDGGSATVDCEGHGTHVAGIAAGATWGAAKQAEIHSVRVLDCSGSGQTSWVVDALNETRNELIAFPSIMAVVNMSLGSGPNTPLDNAVTDFVSITGRAIVHAAGNNNVDACNESPNSDKAISVGAIQPGDARWVVSSIEGSNYGSCVDIFAPGADIKSASNASNTATRLNSGTSMSAPFVAGKVALFLSQHGNTQADTIKHRITTYNATHNVVINLPSGTPSKLVFTRDGVYRPGVGLAFSACDSGMALYTFTSDGNYGPETETYLRQLDIGGTGSWQTHDSGTSTFTLVSVPSGTEFRARARYTVSVGTSPFDTSDLVTAPNCQEMCPSGPCIFP